MVVAGAGIGVKQEVDGDPDILDIELTGADAPVEECPEQVPGPIPWLSRIGLGPMEHGVVEGVVLDLELDPVSNDPVKPFGPTEGVIVENGLRGAEHLLPEIRLEGGEEISSRLVVQVDRSLGYASFLGDLGDRYLVETDIDGEASDGIEYLAAPDLGRLEPSDLILHLVEPIGLPID